MRHIRLRYLGSVARVGDTPTEISPDDRERNRALVFDSRTVDLTSLRTDKGMVISVGRAPDNTFQFSSKELGRNHGELAYRGGTWFLLQSGSMDSDVDGKAPLGEQPIHHGSRLRFGRAVMAVEIVETPTTSWDQMEGAVLGLLIGDALGVPYEFHVPEAIPEASLIEYKPPEGFRGSQDVPPGTWSDDGAQALCLLDSLLHKQSFDAHDFSQRLRAWYTDGYLAVDNYVFDVGITTNTAIKALLRGAPPLEAGPTGERDNGNGSLMRCLPLALWHQGDDASLVQAAFHQSRLTHGHLRSQVCCGLYCLWAKAIMDGAERPWEDAVERLRRLLPCGQASVELNEHVEPDKPPHGTGSGYVVDALHSARLALESPNYESVVRSAIQLGLDTDTTACIAGGIAGLRYGASGIPQRWKDHLRGQDMVEPLLRKLKVHVESQPRLA